MTALCSVNILKHLQVTVSSSDADADRAAVDSVFASESRCLTLCLDHFKSFPTAPDFKSSIDRHFDRAFY